MKTLRLFTFALLAAAIALLSVGTSPVLAQESGVVDAAAFEAALTAHERDADRSRTRLAELLAHDEVRTAAEARGIDLDRVEERSTTLTDEQVIRMEAMVAEASEALELNSTITISVTTVIIILLLLILIT